MARIFTTGFESQHYHSDGFASTTSGYNADTSVCRVSGTRASAYVDSGSPATAPFIHLSFSSTNGYYYYMRQYIRRNTADGQSGIIIATFRNTASAAQLSVKLNASHQLQLFNSNSAANIGSPSVALEANKWYRMEIGIMVSGTGAADSYAELKLDGVTVASSTTEAFSVTALGGYRFGWYSAPTANQRIWFDDMALNNNQGTDQNTWPGDGVVWILLPTGDSARGANWYVGAGATTNLYAAIDNTPPLGVAHANRTATSQIYNATASLTDPASKYDATMQTYTAAGIGDVETIKLVYLAIEVGADAATGRAMNAYIVSNPAETPGGNFNTLAQQAGIFPMNAAGTALGWGFNTRTVLYSPTVTRSTAPVISIHKEVNNAAVVASCYAGIIVETQPVTSSRTISTVSASVGSPSYNRDITGVSAAVQATAERAIAGVSAATQALGIERAIAGVNASASVVYSRAITGTSAAVQALALERAIAGVSTSLIGTSERAITSVSAALLGTSERAVTSVSAAVAAYGVLRSISSVSAAVGAGGVERAITGVSAALAAYGVERSIIGVSAALSGAFVRAITGVSAAAQATVSRDLTGVSASLVIRTERAIAGVAASVIASYARAITGVSAAVLATASLAISNVSAATKATGVTRTITGVSAAAGQVGIERPVTGVGAALQAMASLALSGISASLVQPNSRAITGVTSAVKATGVPIAIAGVSVAAGQGAISRQIAGVHAAVAWDTSGKTFATITVRGARGQIKSRGARGRVSVTGTRGRIGARGIRGRVSVRGARGRITVQKE